MRRGGYYCKRYHDDYEIYYDASSDLEYVRLNAGGLKKIAESYRLDERYRDYNINIAVEEYDFEFRDGPYRIIERHAKYLREGEVKGIICVQKNSSKAGIFHVTPFIVAESGGKTIFVDFEGGFRNISNRINIAKQVPNYSLLQCDMNSCSVFSIDTIKNAFLDREFIRQVKDITSYKEVKGEIDASKVKETKKVKEVIGQGGAFIDLLEKEKVKKYVHEVAQDGIRRRRLNLKAFYKGHCYARKINPNHLELIDDKTREMVLKIDAIRREIKEKKSLSKKDDIEEIDLPDASVRGASLQGARDGSKFCNIL